MAKGGGARTGGTPPWIIFASGLAAGLIGGVLIMNVLGGPGGGRGPAGAPAPVTPGQQAGPDRIKLMRDIAQLEQIVKQDPGNYQAWVQLGNDLFDIKEPRRSIEAYRKALDINGSDPNVWTDMGVMHRDLGEHQQAITAFRKAATLSANHPQSRLNLGVVYLNDLNDPASAIAAWEDYLRIEPTGPRADSIRQQIAQLRAAGGPGAGAPAGTDLERAAAELQKKLDSAPPPR